MQSNDINIVLTEKDLMVLDSYKVMIRGLGEYLGEGYELILHSLGNIEHSVVEIVHGYHSGRTVGAPITDYALFMLKNLQKSENPSGISYFNKNRGNVTLKSCTIPVIGENKRIIGLCCINFYCDIPLENFISNFVSDHIRSESVAQSVTENFFKNSDELIQDSVARIKNEVYEDAQITSSNKNREIILRLEKEGVFNMRDAIVEVADLLHISRNTVYLHIRNIRK